MKLKDITFDPPNHPFAVDVLRSVSSVPGDELTCIKCSKKYKRGDWDFYSLCNDCFYLFDEQKMIGRFGGKEHFENAEAWVKSMELSDERKEGMSK